MRTGKEGDAMAQRRMFSRKITESDQFLDMPMSSQSLYFHINMQADDDGFVGNVKTIKRMIGASDDDLKLLISKRFLIPFDTGIVVIRDWKIHNYIQKDRYTETFYKHEKAMLETTNNKQYQVMDTKCIQDVSSMDTQVRLGKDRLEIELEKDIKAKDVSRSSEQDSIPYEEIIDYFNLKTNKSLKHTTGKTRSLIKARWNEGFRLDDFKRVVDNKCFDWLVPGKRFSNGTLTSTYVRPSTIFGSRFEEYLNENIPKNQNIQKIDNTGVDF